MGSLGPSVVGLQPKAEKTTAAAGGEQQHGGGGGGCGGSSFRMPLHYPRYKKAEYEAMPEWRVDCLLREYGLPVDGDLDAKRRFAMGAFLWPDQY
ncbi:uncharacterized protein [Oryza sativa Japonica Group]|jgi:hypothetical protein|uniref:Os02g0258800 protein n=2 Tax=Oryza sativa subsp. japonica TaxID=39947 RepID=Q0E298_ORYSJ|nr:uncharacterized protein LOC4328929 [Oryza sativa Japonica Group]KAB8086726.1 hypothetical protein EE612_010214 [Oryza sativa]KAF2944077.1 hypothetical protein DAI22_02g113100 [Oryza sativa Japonica Group]BAD20063.1 unknown protein [Oryza sativa Japonica Group]BAD20109.1 unknown protein [Oryza sativa Japonica Group]BAF08390.1 Os02g0258800 [Oryza sativa Japonica Group]|eukprot:NP_001046476.1 Os02g0258800 [Oryza sativa Japonica Group]